MKKKYVSPALDLVMVNSAIIAASNDVTITPDYVDENPQIDNAIWSGLDE